MSQPTSDATEGLAHDVQLHVFNTAARTGEVPQPPAISVALDRPLADVKRALEMLAAGKVLILAPNGGDIWAANPFCAVPSGFRVATDHVAYWGICIWDALGVAAAVGKDAAISAACGDCCEPMTLEVRGGRLARSEGVIHFGVPAHHWWDNIGFT